MLMNMLMDMKQLVPKKNTPAESTSPIVKEKSPQNKWIRNRFLYKRFSQFLFKFFKSLVGMQDAISSQRVPQYFGLRSRAFGHLVFSVRIISSSGADDTSWGGNVTVCRIKLRFAMLAEQARNILEGCETLR